MLMEVLVIFCDIVRNEFFTLRLWKQKFLKQILLTGKTMNKNILLN